MNKDKIKELVRVTYLNRNPWMQHLTEEDIDRMFNASNIYYDYLEDKEGNIEAVHLYQVDKDVMNSLLLININKRDLKELYATGVIKHNVIRVVGLDRKFNFRCFIVTKDLKDKYIDILNNI